MLTTSVLEIAPSLQAFLHNQSVIVYKFYSAMAFGLGLGLGPGVRSVYRQEHIHFKTLGLSIFNVYVLDMQWTPLHACPHCVGRKKMFIFIF